VISTVSSQPPMISDELRRVADHFIDLNSLKNDIGRAISDRPANERSVVDRMVGVGADDEEDSYED
jgi:uncharacterized LabA/DUF88 family protein